MAATASGDFLWNYLCDQVWEEVRGHESSPGQPLRQVESAKRFARRQPPSSPAEYHERVIEWGRVQLGLCRHVSK